MDRWRQLEIAILSFSLRENFLTLLIAMQVVDAKRCRPV